MLGNYMSHFSFMDNMVPHLHVLESVAVVVFALNVVHFSNNRPILVGVLSTFVLVLGYHHMSPLLVGTVVSILVVCVNHILRMYYKI